MKEDGTKSSLVDVAGPGYNKAMLRELPAIGRGISLVVYAARRVDAHSATALAGMAAPLVLEAADAITAIGARNYSYIHDSISSLALTRIGYIPIIAFMASGLLIEVFIAGLLYNVRHDRGFQLGIAAMVLFGFFMLLIGAFRTDPAGTAVRSTHGIIHGLSASSAFWLFPIGLFFMARSIKHDPAWASLFRYTIVTAALAVVLAFLAIYLNHRIDWYGLLERLLVVNMILWVEVASFRMLVISITLTSGGPRQERRWKP